MRATCPTAMTSWMKSVLFVRGCAKLSVHREVWLSLVRGDLITPLLSYAPPTSRRTRPTRGLGRFLPAALRVYKKMSVILSGRVDVQAGSAYRFC